MRDEAPSPPPMSLGEARHAFREWLVRWREMVPPEDREALSLPHLLRSVVRYARFHEGKNAPSSDIGSRDPALMALFADLFRAFGQSYFRTRTFGVENVPAKGPVLLVGNHSGGLVTIDSFLASVALVDTHGTERAPFALAHDFLFDDPVLRKYTAKLGVLRAGHEGASAALRAGHSVLVYPGSDFDAFRSYRDRDRVILGGRKGFLKLALREQVPIVPVVCAGSHEQWVVLARGDGLARAMGLHKRIRINVFPIVLALPWGLTSGFLPYWPLPTQVTIGFGKPLTWPHLGPEAARDEAALESCYGEVEGRMQEIMDRMVEARARTR